MDFKIIIRIFEKKKILFTSTLIIPILYLSYKDYKKWIKLGPGGIQSNIFG